MYRLYGLSSDHLDRFIVLSILTLDKDHVRGIQYWQIVFPNKKLANSLVLEFCQNILNYFLNILRLTILKDSFPSISPHVYFNGALIHRILINLHSNHQDISKEFLDIL